MNKKRIYKVHRWSGVTIGILLFLMGLSGISISFREELMPRIYPELFQIEAQSVRLPLHDLYTSAQTYLGPKKRITNLYGAEEPDEAYLILYKDPASSFPWMLTLNPYSGTVVGEMSMLRNFFAVMLLLHSNLFLGKVGSYVIGLLGIVLFFFVVSGIYIWLPYKHVLLKWKRTFQLSKIQLTQRIHHGLGITFSLILLISAVTGFLTIFDLSYHLLRPLRGEAVRIEDKERKSTCTFEQQFQVLKGISRVMEENLISVHFCTHKNGLMKVSYGLHDRDFLNGYGRIIVDPLTGETVQEANSEKDPSSWNIKRLTIYPIHTGQYLGYPGRIFVFMSGMALMVIYCTGVILFMRRSRRTL